MIRRFLTFGLALLALVAVAVSCGGDGAAPTVTPTIEPTSTSLVPTATLPQTSAPTPTPAQQDGGAERGATLVTQKGCIACHSRDGSTGVGPTWKGAFGAVRSLADGSTVAVDESYLRESILDPSAKVPEGFLAGLMPQTYGDTLSDDDVDAIIAYIKTLQ